MTPSNRRLLSRLLGKVVPEKGGTKITLTLDALDRVIEEARIEERHLAESMKPILPDSLDLFTMYKKKPPRW